MYLCQPCQQHQFRLHPARTFLGLQSSKYIQPNLDITIPDIAISLQVSDIPSAPLFFLQYINDILFIMIIISILGPKVRI
jgi:hypothetical protein